MILSVTVVALFLEFNRIWSADCKCLAPCAAALKRFPPIVFEYGDEFYEMPSDLPKMALLLIDMGLYAHTLTHTES